MNREEWVQEFCRRLEIDPPSAAEFAELLDLAAIAAHASERPAAPLACWAAGRSRRDPGELIEIARQVGPPSAE